MQYPLIGKQLLSDLRLAHGIFNFVVMLLFLHQARLGMAIRSARQGKAPLPFPAIKRHRRSGPLFAGLAASGYVTGLVLVLLDTGNLLEYPAHLSAGTFLVLALALTVFLSRRIKGQDPSYRVRHAVAGVVLLVLFLVQALLGIGVLF